MTRSEQRLDFIREIFGPIYSRWPKLRCISPRWLEFTSGLQTASPDSYSGIERGTLPTKSPTASPRGFCFRRRVFLFTYAATKSISHEYGKKTDICNTQWLRQQLVIHKAVAHKKYRKTRERYIVCARFPNRESECTRIELPSFLSLGKIHLPQWDRFQN